MFKFVETQPLPSQEDCYFYHSMDIPGVGTIPGSWDLRGRFNDYVGGINLRGKSLLDVGTAGGFLTFEAEKQGAQVTSFDAESVASVDFNMGEDSLRRLKNSYWFAHHHLKSKARAVYGDIRSLSTIVPPSDVVLVAQILVHIRDPLEIIRQASLVAREHLVIVEGSFESNQPLASFLGAGNVAGVHSWWHLSAEIYRRWLAMLGFEVIKTKKDKYRCNDPSLLGDVDVWTFIARRK